MNSYQTINAAFAAAGLTKQAAVNYGRRYEAGLYNPFGRRSLFDMLVHLQRQQLGGYFENLPAFPNAPRVDHDPVGRWNAEDKERQLRIKAMSLDAAAATRDYTAKAEWSALRGKRANVMIGDDFEPVTRVHDSVVYERKRGTGGIAAAGGTSRPSYVVRSTEEFFEEFFEVVNTRTNVVHLRFRQHMWASITASAYNAGQTPRQYMEVNQINDTGYTLS